MGLTSGLFQILLGALAVLAFAATVRWWPRLARRGRKAVAARIGALLATQLLMLTALGAVANAYFGFYTSWSDLFGLDTGLGTVVDHRLHASSPGPVTVLGERRVYSPYGAAPDRSGSIQQIGIRGRRSGISTPAYVYLPPQYFQAAYAHRSFPLALVLSGYPGSAEKLITLMRYPDFTLRAVSKGTLPPTVLVMMRPTVAPPRDTECVDIPGGPQVETFFADDLPEALSAAYRIDRSPAAHAVLGNSTGGYCAVKLAMRRPDAYRAAVSLSGYYTAAVDPTTGDLFGGSKRLRRENDLIWRLRTMPAPPVAVLLGTSRDEHNHRATQQFIRSFRAPMQVSSITLDHGGHNFRTWTREIPPALDWLGRHLRTTTRM